MKPSIIELKENCIASGRQYFRNLRIIYSQLHDVAYLINSTYGFSLLYTIIWVFVSIISGANYAIQLKHTELLYVLQAVLWIGLSMAIVTMMAVSCSLAVNECNRSPIIV
jgi:hypothetical protein